jgi:hypothetical protein
MMDVNDNAYFLNERVALESIASKLAPTEKQKALQCEAFYLGFILFNSAASFLEKDRT